MKVTFADSFSESLNNISRHDTRLYKIYKAIRYDIPRFFKTVWLFRKELYGYHVWDNSYPMNMFKRGLILLADNVEEHGSEVDISRLKKVAKMRRAIELLHAHSADNFLEMAEKELGDVYNIDYMFIDNEPEPKDIARNNDKILKLSIKLEKETWNELFQILQGQNSDELYGNEKMTNNEGVPLSYDEWFDGSGLKGWWD